MDVENNNYALQTSSPCWETGFVALDLNSVGPRVAVVDFSTSVTSSEESSFKSSAPSEDSAVSDETSESLSSSTFSQPVTSTSDTPLSGTARVWESPFLLCLVYTLVIIW